MTAFPWPAPRKVFIAYACHRTAHNRSWILTVLSFFLLLTVISLSLAIHEFPPSRATLVGMVFGSFPSLVPRVREFSRDFDSLVLTVLPAPVLLFFSYSCS